MDIVESFLRELQDSDTGLPIDFETVHRLDNYSEALLRTLEAKGFVYYTRAGIELVVGGYQKRYWPTTEFEKNTR